MTALLYMSLISGFIFPYFLIKAIKNEDAPGAVFMSCACFGVIVLTVILQF